MCFPLLLVCVDTWGLDKTKAISFLSKTHNNIKTNKTKKNNKTKNNYKTKKQKRLKPMFPEPGLPNNWLYWFVVFGVLFVFVCSFCFLVLLFVLVLVVFFEAFGLCALYCLLERMLLN